MNGVRRSLRVNTSIRLDADIFSWASTGHYGPLCRRKLWKEPGSKRFVTNDTLKNQMSTGSDKPFYVTTPIFYPNATPHIGHLHSLVTADVFVRHARLTNPSRGVRFITGTDEHGMKIQKTAREKDLSEIELCDGLSQTFLGLSNAANISFTRFMRTSSDEHKRGVTHLWNELVKRNYIYKGTHSGWYSVSDECFYTSTQVKDGLDPKTGNPCKVSIETGSAVEWTEEVNWKFRLSDFRERLLEHFLEHRSAIHPPHQYDEIIKILSLTGSGGLSDLSVSRPFSRISWGVRVPADDSQTIYVWLDALTTYLTGIGYPWKNAVHRECEGWPADLHVIGKDILRFHAIYFPAFLLALDIPLPRALLSHSHWTANKAKMSKSLGNVVDPFVQMSELGVDVVRWYLSRVGGRFRDDVDWSNEQLRKHKDELQSLLGNFYLRLLSKKIISRLPQSHQHVPLDRSILLKHELHQHADSPRESEIANASGVCRELRASLSELSQVVDTRLRKFEVAEALEAIIACLNDANKMFTNARPWSSSTPPSVVLEVMTWSRETLRICAILLQPFIPGKAAELLDALRVSEGMRTWSHAGVGNGEEFIEEADRGLMYRVVLFERGDVGRD